MFKRILVPVDLSDKNEKALEAAFQLAEKTGASVGMLHVIETLPHLPFDEVKDFYKRLEAAAREKLRRLGDRLEEKGRQAALDIVYGKRVEEIVQHAMEKDVDLIVLSSHKTNLEKPGKGLGTLSHQIGILAPCAVMLVK